MCDSKTKPIVPDALQLISSQSNCFLVRRADQIGPGASRCLSLGQFNRPLARLGLNTERAGKRALSRILLALISNSRVRVMVMKHRAPQLFHFKRDPCLLMWN